MTSKDNLGTLLDDTLFCLDHGRLDDDVGKAMLGIVQAGACDPCIAGMIRGRARKERIRQAFNRMPFREPRLGSGELAVGLDIKGRPLPVPIQYLNAHSLTVANTGSGKTTKSRFYILQIAPHVSGMWLVDLRKREFRVLRKYLARLRIDLVILPGRRMRINPLQVPLGVDPIDWSTRIADMLIQVLDLPPRASKLIQATSHRLYRRFKILEGAAEFPTLFDLFEEIRQDKRANPQSRLAILDSLDPVLSSLGPEVLAYRTGWSSHDLAGCHLALEFAGLAECDKNLLLNYLPLAEFTSRVARGISNPRMDLWICCDEAQRLCSAAGAAQANGGISDLIGLVRGTGIGLDLSVLSMTGLASQVPSNCATKIMGRCGSAADYAAAGHSMGLNAEQIQWAQHHLKPGMFIAQLGEGNWRYPFVFTIPPMELSNVAPSQIDDGGLGEMDALPIVCADEFKHWGQPVGDIDGGSASSASPAPACMSASTSPPPAVFASEQEYRFCKAVAGGPMQPSSTYAKLAGIGSKTALSARRRLVAAGYIAEHKVQKSSRGRASILLEVLPAGEAAIASHELGVNNHAD